jgi:exonuclease III
MRRQKADLVCLQEIKAQEADLPKALAQADREGGSGQEVPF